ncbi:Os09g0354300 [Oryza sativa Japonica Group]|uniref:Os09g0354300 protein n=1 Tax=Oryza sativa subsp. japonica TaxID=39947 RepID=Q0J2D8_ORYSJ|nr:Os09g0354300 [Oryza sativa Japonica Group]|eukprot:NP_001062963.1 Os09g0354300 [Oryza sativa Japonica Group]
MAFADPHLQIPDSYVRAGEVPAGEVVGGADDESLELPVVDMARLLDPEHREEEIAWLGSACRSWGFFQLVNHGVDEAVIQKMKDNTIRPWRQRMALQRYPPCRHPEKVMGIAPHSDGFGLTLLLQVNDTPGLQVSKDGRWRPVRPLPGAFVINVGEILEVLTNGYYKSVFHRVVVDTDKDRVTVVVFQDACIAGVVKPLPELGEQRYHATNRSEYYKGQLKALRRQGEKFVDTLKK